MKDLLITLGGLIAMAAVIYGLSRYIGLGKCMRCGRAIAPWNAYCGRESCGVTS